MNIASGMFVNYLNLIMCLGIFVVGYLAYKKKKDKLLLNIGIAFGFFAVSHLVVLLGFRGNVATMLVLIRAIAYLIILVALSRFVSAKV